MTHDKTERPLVLISNDDGYSAKGVKFLIETLADLADIIAVCPDGPRSGQSMAITVDGALRLHKLDDLHGATMYKLNGTPVDCVKLAMHTVVPRKPDMVIAGINHGSNASVNVNYSGTMGAVFEGCAGGIDAIGFSLTDHDPHADFQACRPFVRAIFKAVRQHGLPKGVCLNVNIPNSAEPPTQMRLVREARGQWSDEYERYTGPNGHPFYMLSGRFANAEPEATDTDEYCLHHGIVSIVPERFGRTADLSEFGWLENLCKSAVGGE